MSRLRISVFLSLHLVQIFQHLFHQAVRRREKKGYYSRPTNTEGDGSRETNLTILTLIEYKYNNFNNVFYQYEKQSDSDISGNILFKYYISPNGGITYETNNFYIVFWHPRFRQTQHKNDSRSRF